MHSVRDVLTPEALGLMEAVHRTGSLAAAARELGVVPSALTYRVRQMEDALDVLLFDRSSRQARLTDAGHELLREGNRLLIELDAVAHRVRRVATGWEPQLTITADGVVSSTTLFELCEAFYALNPPTRLRIRSETLSGTWETLVSGQADLAIGCVVEVSQSRGILSRPMGQLAFVYAVAPHHPLAGVTGSISDELLQRHRAVAVADTTLRGSGLSVGLLGGQDVLTVPTMQHKLEAQLRGMGCGFLPECLARPYIAAGRLVVKTVDRRRSPMPMSYAWRGGTTATVKKGGRPALAPSASGAPGRGLSWWLEQLASPLTQLALLTRHHSV
ncbi:MAG: LysR family transcriptional regulator [Pseudomonadota bacterium]|uniref:LysR family transcriptional regulator n=1 Tax=Polaromonas sp. TaxID=1869339 RepID=UPI0017F19A67|nr:LysR family transcriptional regulator [Polaromonas sp.]MBA3593827.1 LysR family transcriptional regulator [Polaromonas sp.]MDQ3271004.1 LysR family transcriptional regulator [Pseudomonadota bacterium]